LVAFDGSELAAAALRRAVEFAEAAGTDVVAASVVPADRPVAGPIVTAVRRFDVDRTNACYPGRTVAAVVTKSPT
jgi:nucleotide-binding universal stress UspA family protein